MPINIYVIEFDEDDPKKCTGKRMIKFGYARKSYKPFGIVLNPLAKAPISADDKEIAERWGITVIDSSWNQSDEGFFMRFNSKFSRRLPFLLAGNPINYSKPFKLSSIEAVAAALYIIGEVEMARELMNKVKWGHTFLELNGDLLELYRGKRVEEVLKIEEEVMRGPQQ